MTATRTDDRTFRSRRPAVEVLDVGVAEFLLDHARRPDEEDP